MAVPFLLLWASIQAIEIDVAGPPEISGRKRRRRHGDEELTEAEVQFMHRKLSELKRAKTEREQAEAAKSLEIALAQAAQDDEAADVITATIQEKRPEAIAKSDYGAVMRDVGTLTDIVKQLDKIVKQAAAERRRLEDEDDIETMLMML